MSSRKAIIIGAGVAGLATALHLKRSTDIEPVVYEMRPEPSALGGAVGIASNGTRLLDRLGVLETLLQRGCSRSDFVAYSLQSGKLGGLDDFATKGRAKTGYGYLRIQRKDLVLVLLEAVRKAGISIHFGHKLVKVHEGTSEVVAEFENGSTDAGHVLLGCDGIHSLVRSLYVDPATQPEYSGVAAVYSITSTNDVSSLVTDHLKGITVALTRQGIFLAVPCTANEDEIYWGLSREVALPEAEDARDGWEVQREQEVEYFRKNLHDILAEGRGGGTDALRELLNATPTMKFYPIYWLPTGGTWVRGRCVLLGDSAHAVSPHVGQGASMALEDASLAVRALADSNRSVEEALQVYERLRQPRVNEVLDSARELTGMRREATPEQQSQREDGMRVALSTTDGMDIADKFLGQKFSTYDIDEEKV